MIDTHIMQVIGSQLEMTLCYGVKMPGDIWMLFKEFIDNIIKITSYGLVVGRLDA